MLELELGLLNQDTSSGSGGTLPPLQTINVLNQAIKLTPSATTVKLTTTGVPGPRGPKGDVGDAGPPGPAAPLPPVIDGGHF